MPELHDSRSTARHMSHPRYREWLRTQSPEDGAIPLPTPGLSFESWLDASPRIRGENPPDFDLTHVQELQSEIRMATVRMWGFASLLLLEPFQVVITYHSFATGMAVQAAVLIGLVFGVAALFKRSKLTGELNDFLKIAPLDIANGEYHPRHFELDTYNTDFTSPLADRTTIQVTAYFQIPRELNKPVTGYNSVPQSPHFVEQLNRVSEAKLIAYSQEFTRPPSRLAIEDMLNRELVRFQNESRVAVLRVEIPIVVHITPEGPMAVRV